MIKIYYSTVCLLFLLIQHQFDENEDQHESWIDTSKNVSVISQAEFDKLKTKTPEKMQPPPTPLNTPAANGEVEPSTSAANRHVRPNQPHFYPVTKEPTTPSQVYMYL